LAHCDTLDGPVVTDARAALEQGDVTPVLKWVAAGDEPGIRSAFTKALLVRTKGPEARELADMYFFETLVRVHRAGEGAPYTGLKPAGTDPGPAVAAADESLRAGSVDRLAQAVADEVAAGIRKRFTEAMDAHAHADESVAKGRAFVAAYVDFVHYVEGLHEMAGGGTRHGHE
jgi:hypothetical protein